MSDVFIGLEEAAAFEGIKYNTLIQRMKRNPQQFKTKTQPREGGGKDQVMISVASLSAKGRKAWKAAQKVDGRDVIIDKRTDAGPLVCRGRPQSLHRRGRGEAEEGIL